MNATRFAAGQTFDAFVRSAQKYQDLWESVYARAGVPEEVLKALRGVDGPRYLAVLNEDWCIDAVGAIPAVARMAQLLEGFELRSFGRDANPDLMDAHLTNGGRSIPVIIVYDGDWVERGWWGPRPAPLQAWVQEHAPAIEKAEKYRYIRTWYARDKGETAVRELADIILAQ